MIIIDTSAWIEFFNKNSNYPSIKNTVRYCLENEYVGIGDLIYCEILQGIKHKNELIKVKTLLSGLQKYNMVNFELADLSAANHRLIRKKGITIRKTIDMLIGTFCIQKDFQLIHNDSDFSLIEKHLGLKVFKI